MPAKRVSRSQRKTEDASEEPAAAKTADPQTPAPPSARRSSRSKPVEDEEVEGTPEATPAKRVSRSRRTTAGESASAVLTPAPAKRSSRSSRSKPALEVAEEQDEEKPAATPAKRVSRSRRKTEDAADESAAGGQ